ncbi:MAG: winged helix-turn-helix domain-containing protein, partial [Acidobacteriota bacterium]
MQPFLLAEWSIQPAAGTASSGDETIRLEPKVMAVLVYLAGRAGEVVPKDDILDEVWRGTFVKEVVLARGISELRRLLGDDARDPRLIETIPKRGYRLIAEVEPLESAGPLAWPEPGRRSWLGLIPALAAVALATVVLVSWLYASWAKPHPSSIVVLPFRNLSGDTESDYFSDGMTEDLIAALSKIRQLRVVSRTSAMTYKDSTENLRAIGRELGVASVVEGSVRRENNRVRITAQLIDVGTDTHLWVETYDRELAGIFDIQRSVADRIAAALEAELTAEERRELERSPTREFTAHDRYLRGREHYLRYQPEANETAIGLYLRALDLDPRFALAQAALASAYALRVTNYGLGSASLEPAESAAQAALALDPDLPEAHKALGMVYSA